MKINTEYGYISKKAGGCYIVTTIYKTLSLEGEKLEYEKGEQISKPDALDTHEPSRDNTAFRMTPYEYYMI